MGATEELTVKWPRWLAATRRDVAEVTRRRGGAAEEDNLGDSGIGEREGEDRLRKESNERERGSIDLGFGKV